MQHVRPAPLAEAFEQSLEPVEQEGTRARVPRRLHEPLRQGIERALDLGIARAADDLGGRVPEELDDAIVDVPGDRRLDLRFAQHAAETVGAFLPEGIECVRHRFLGDNEAGHDALVEAEILHEAVEQLPEHVLDPLPRIRVVQQSAQTLDRDREIVLDRVLQRGHEPRGNQLLEGPVRPEQLPRGLVQMAAYRHLEGGRIGEPREPAVHRVADGGDPFRLQRPRKGFVAQRLPDRFEEAPGFIPEVRGIQRPRQELPSLPENLREDLADLHERGLGEEVGERGLLALAEFDREFPQPFPEGGFELPQFGGDVFRREERAADDATDRIRQPLLILRHGSLQPAHGAAKNLRRTVGMEDHPYGDPVRNPARQGAEGHRDEGAQPVEFHQGDGSVAANPLK